MNFVAAGPSGSLAIVESFHSLANTLYAKSVEVKANTISERGVPDIRCRTCRIQDGMGGR